MSDEHIHDWRVNPMQTIRSWPASLTAVCAHTGCQAQRQLGPRGWTLKRQPISRWPRIEFDGPRARDPQQLTITGK